MLTYNFAFRNILMSWLCFCILHFKVSKTWKINNWLLISWEIFSFLLWKSPVIKTSKERCYLFFFKWETHSLAFETEQDTWKFSLWQPQAAIWRNAWQSVLPQAVKRSTGVQQRLMSQKLKFSRTVTALNSLVSGKRISYCMSVC